MIFDKILYGSFFGKIGEFFYKYEYIDSKKNGFIDYIKCFYKEVDNNSANLEDGPDKPVEHELKISYLWDGEKYSQKNLVKSTVNNLRVRSDWSLDSTIITKLNKDEIVTFIKRGKLEKIDETWGFWIKIETENEKEGWCSDAYTENIFTFEK